MQAFFLTVMIAPTVIHLALFWAGVQVETLIMAFTGQQTKAFTFGNFRQVLQSMFKVGSGLPIAEAFRNTFIFFFISLLTVPLQIFAAYMIYKKMRGSAFIRVILFLPGAVSSIMMALMFQQLMMSDGPILHFLNGVLKLGIHTPLITESPIQLIISFDLWLGLGGGLIVWLGAMSRIPSDVIEYGRLDGVGTVREFFQIIMPLIWPTFVTLMTLALIGVFGASGSIMIFTEGAYGTYTISYWLYDVVYRSSDTLYNYAAALGLLLTAATLPIVIAGRVVMRKFGEAVEY